nr:MAG TPA: minor capsid protein [Caudoviricetes sp.]
MADIGAELLEKIRAYFKKKCQGDAYIQSVLGKVAAGTAQMEEISLLSQSIGFRASQAISEFVNVAALPDGKMYYNIADTILSGVLKDNYEIINSAAAECQLALDRKMGINIEPQRAPYPAERVQAAAGAASAPDISEEKMVRRMTSTTENITRSFYDDYVETNVKYRSEAGLECFIIRSDHGGCCKWCAALAGKYRYPEEVPKDVYRRHDNCTCTVTYTNGRKAQDVWSKTSRELPAEERERMKQIGFKTPTISAEERERMKIMGFKKPQRLDFSAESSIIDKGVKVDMQYFAKKSSDFPTVQLPKNEYAHVMSEIATHISEEQKAMKTFSKPIGDHMYLVENNGFGDYRIIGKKKLK